MKERKRYTQRVTIAKCRKRLDRDREKQVTTLFKETDNDSVGVAHFFKASQSAKCGRWTERKYSALSTSDIHTNPFPLRRAHTHTTEGAEVTLKLAK